MLNDRMNLLLQRLTALGDTHRVLSSRVGGLEREREALNKLLGIERQKTIDLTRLLEATRTQLAGKEKELQR